MKAVLAPKDFLEKCNQRRELNILHGVVLWYIVLCEHNSFKLASKSSNCAASRTFQMILGIVLVREFALRPTDGAVTCPGRRTTLRCRRIPRSITEYLLHPCLSRPEAPSCRRWDSSSSMSTGNRSSSSRTKTSRSASRESML